MPMMFFAKLAITLVLAVPLVSALTIDTPSGWTSGGTASLTWTTESGDPDTFTIELVNEQNGQYALANNVETSDEQISLTLPTVSEGLVNKRSPDSDDYTVQFVNISDATDIYAESGTFSIGAEVSSSISSVSSSPSSVSSATSSSSAASASGTSTTRSNSTATAASATGTSTGSTSGVVGSSTASDSGAVALGISSANLASFGVMAVAALAGARLVGF